MLLTLPVNGNNQPARRRKASITAWLGQAISRARCGTREPAFRPPRCCWAVCWSARPLWLAPNSPRARHRQGLAREGGLGEGLHGGDGVAARRDARQAETEKGKAISLALITSRGNPRCQSRNCLPHASSCTFHQGQAVRRRREPTPHTAVVAVVGGGAPRSLLPSGAELRQLTVRIICNLQSPWCCK